MIEGLKLQFTGTELRNMISERIGYHDERIRVLKQQMKVLADADIRSQSHTVSASDTMEGRVLAHENMITKLKLFRDHLLEAETYRLADGDLYQIDILQHRF